MCNIKTKNLHLMVENVIFPRKASTMFRTQWMNTNYPVWAKEIFLERFTREKVPKYLSSWYITDDIVMGVIANLLDMSGFRPITGRSIYSMRTTSGKYKSIWKLNDVNKKSNMMSVIVDGRHLDHNKLQCNAYIATNSNCYQVSSITINTLQYLPAFYERKFTKKNKRNRKGFHLSLLSKYIQYYLLEPIKCELDAVGVKLLTLSSLLSRPKILNEAKILRINNNETDMKLTCGRNASKFWKEVINVKKHLSIGCPNCFDVKNQLSEETI